MKIEHIKEFLALRDALIDALEVGEIDKTAFVQGFYEAIVEKQLKPVRRIETDPFMLGIYNYQYYNTMAKHAMQEADATRFRDSAISRRFYDEALDAYASKERSLSHMLELLGDEVIEAYPLLLDSEMLSGNLFEIVLVNRRRAIFHAQDPRLKNRLIRRGAFSETPRKSCIHNYVNEKYV